MRCIPPVDLNTGLLLSRAGTATYVGDGLVKTAAVDEPRYEDGLPLVEGFGRNEALYSKDFANAYWSKPFITIDAAATVDPEGTTQGTKLSITGSTARALSAPLAVSAGQTKTIAFFCKAAEFHSVQIYFLGSGEIFFGTFDLSTGTATGAGAAIRLIGSGWYRCSLTFVASATATGTTSLQFQRDSAPLVGGIYTWGAQFETGRLTSYIPTEGAPADRAPDTFAAISGVLSTTAIEAFPNYGPGATYALGAKVVYNKRIYQSIAAANTGNQPDVSPTKWTDTGPSNAWAMFDNNRNTPTTAIDSLQVTIAPGQRVDSIFLGGLVANEVTITMATAAGGQIYSHTQRLVSRDTRSWYEYYTGPFRRQASLIRFDLPVDAKAIITITLTGSGTVAISSVAVGMSVYMGCVQYGASDDGQNYSRIEREFDGTLLLTPRPNLPISDQVVWVEKANVNRVRQLRADLAGRYAIWSGLDDKDEDGYFEPLLIAGVYRRFKFDFSHPSHAILNLQLEEAA